MKGFLTSTERNLSPGRVKSRILTLLLILISCLFVNPSFLRAESRFDGKIIQKVELQSDGPLSRISTRDVLKLVVLREGAPYSASAAQRSIRRLYSTEIFHDVQIDVEPIGADQVGVKIFLIRKFSIQEFKFEGHLRLGRKQLRRELAFRSGEAYSEILMEEILSRLREIYERNGYYRPRIQPEFELDHRAARLTLRFRIDAGEQSRVDQLDFDVEGDLDLVKIRSLMKTREQAPFSRNQLEEDIRGLERYLAFQGYLRSYVAETVRYDDTKNSVSLTLRIVLRKKTKIEFQGIDANWEELADLPVFSRRGTTPIFLEATGKELRERYQKQGHFQARVEYETLGTERDFSAIVIKVSKGQKYDLKKVLFEGNEFAEDKTLLQIIRVETSGVFSRGRFSTEMAEEDVNRIRSYYQQRGFRDVDVSYGLLVENPHADDLSLVYKIEEGPRYFIEAVEFIGNEQLSTESLLKEIQGRPATPFSPSVVAQDRANVIAAYETRGYRQVDFRSEILYPEPGRARLTYFIQEGPQFFTDEVILTGNLSTRESVIRREVELSSKDPLSLGRVLEGESNLYNLAVFNKVQIREAPSYADPLQKNVIINVEEAQKYTLLYGIGYSSFEGLRGTFGITNNNFMGTASALSLGLRVGAKRQRANISYTLPRLFGRKLPTVISLTGTNEEALTESIEGGREALRGKPFDEFRLVASVQTERRLSRRESLFFRYNLENVQINLPENLAIPLQFFREEQRLRLSSFSISYLNESRDDPTNPRVGFFLAGDARLSTRAIGSDEDFFRILTQGQYYHKLFPDLVLASSLRLGVIAPFGKTASERVDNPVPISERFFSGGSTTLRGLPQDLAGPLLRDPETEEVILVNDRGERDPNGRPVPLGGNGLVIANVELRFPIVAFLSGALFYDVGNVFRSLTDLSSGFSNAVGLGVQVNTPVGPIRFDAGYNPNPPNVIGFKRWNFHFSLGQAF